MFDTLLWPFVAGLVLTGIHAYFGLHVLARGVIFVDLSLAQVAALGLAIAILAGHSVESEAAYWYAFSFAALGAVLFALARAHERALPQEAVIGIVYAVSASMGVLALDRAPQGSEHIKQLLIGSILTVTPEEVSHLALLYAGIGALQFALRKPLIEVSFDPALAAGRRNVFVWDLVFYASFALVVTSSVRTAGVLLVFSYLIVPAAIAGVLTTSLPRRLLLGWALGAAFTAAGLYASWTMDLPTGPAIVTAFGAAAALVAVGVSVQRLTPRKLGIGVSACGVGAGLLLVVNPQMDQPWLDRLEDLAPPVQTLFLDAGERLTRDESLAAVERTRTELARLRALEQDVRWGSAEMQADKAERLRQYLSGRAEIAAGDELVLRELRRKARARQRLALGLPLLSIGAFGLVGLWPVRGRS
jgi:zinc/manganese transport system permease protein